MLFYSKEGFVRRILCFFVLLTGPILIAEEIATESIGSESISQPENAYPWQISSQGDWVANAKIDGKHKRGHFNFAEVTNELMGVVYYNRNFREGATIALGYDYTLFDWNKNRKFNQTGFNTAYFGCDLFTERLHNWKWLGEFGLNLDIDHFEFDYATYDITLWGKYQFRPDIGFHIGFIDLAGIDINMFYPIIGIDWEISKQWKLNLVFPVNVSLFYSLNKEWSFSIAGRFFNSRHRVGWHEHLKKAVFEYRSVGIEAAANYAYNSIVTANLHAGATVWGRFKIANRHNDHAHHFNLKSAPYIGGEINIRF